MYIRHVTLIPCFWAKMKGKQEARKNIPANQSYWLQQRRESIHQYAEKKLRKLVQPYLLKTKQLLELNAMLTEDESPENPENRNRIESKKRLARLQIPRLEIEIQDERNRLVNYIGILRDYYCRKVVSPYCSGYQQVHPRDITCPDIDIKSRLMALTREVNNDETMESQEEK